MKPIEILIVTRSVVLQQGLRALLESLPDVPIVTAVRDLQGAFFWIEEHKPRLILLDESLIVRNLKAALEKIRALSPETQRALLVDNVEEVNLLLTHAEAILIKGVSPSIIASTITKLFSTNGGNMVNAIRDE